MGNSIEWWHEEIAFGEKRIEEKGRIVTWREARVKGNNNQNLWIHWGSLQTNPNPFRSDLLSSRMSVLFPPKPEILLVPSSTAFHHPYPPT